MAFAGRRVTCNGARIAGVVSCVPARRVGNSDFEERFGADGVADVVKLIGVSERRHVSGSQSTADLCAAAGERLLERLGWERDSVDALLFFSQTPSYVLPPTSCVLQSALGVPPGIIAFDVNLGCSGYPYALWLAMTLVQTGAAKRVLLAVGDTISRIVDPQDRSTALLFGDAGTMTAVEALPDDEGAEGLASFVLGTDGTGVRNLIVPQGAFGSYPAGEDTRMQGKDPSCLFMDGGEIFNFTLRAVPPLVAATCEAAGDDAREYDAYLFHQANMFMLKHLTKKAKLPMEKVPMNIDQFGNTSSASIPLLMTTALADDLARRSCKISMFGFGVGYSWAGASMDIGPLAVAETIEL